MAAVREGIDTAAGSRFARLIATLRQTLAGTDHHGLWTLTVDGVISGALFRAGDRLELSLFEGADPRLAGFEPLAREPFEIERALSARLGGEDRVRLTPVPAWA